MPISEDGKVTKQKSNNIAIDREVRTPKYYDDAVQPHVIYS